MHQLIRGSWPPVYLGSVLLALILLFSTPGSAYGETPEADRLILPLRDAVYNHEMTDGEYRSLHQQTLDEIRSSSLSPSDSARARALAHYYLGRWYQAIKTTDRMEDYAGTLRDGRYLALRRFYTERDNAMEAYREARKEAEIYEESVPGAEAHRLLGEILGQMLFLGDAGDLIAIGGKARKNVDKALEENPLHIKARIQEASRLAYTPISYGGDPEEARNAYKAIMRLGVNDTEDLFNIYCGFGMAAFAEENDEQAAYWFTEASGIYPGNIFAAGMLQFITGSGSERAS